MKRLLLTGLTICLSLAAQAQFNIDLDKMSGLSPDTHYRDDMLWSSEAANVAPRKWGNVSFVTPLRIGLRNNWEMSTSLVGDFFCPQFYLKHLYTKKSQLYYLSSKYSISTAYSGLSMGKQYKNERVIGTADTIPFVMDVGHELIFSRALRTDLNCSDGSEWLIITASLGTYFGYNWSQAYGLRPMNYHFLAPRTANLVDTGITLKFKLWVDGRVKKWLMVRGGFMYWYDFKHKRKSAELHAYGEVFLTRRLSASAGLSLSWSNYNELSHRLGIAPMADLCYYFGRKARKTSTLFETNGKLR